MLTFQLKTNRKIIELNNPSFNAFEPEDPIYNPRVIPEQIYPIVNISSTNADMIFKHLEYLLQDESLKPSGEFDRQTIDRLSRKILKSISRVESAPAHGDLFLYARLNGFDKLFRYALALDDTVVWI